MGAKESVEAAAKMNADGWGHVERSSRYHNHRHNQRSQSLNRGQALSQADVSGMW
ncbi:uncharacterized protein [Drosophila suzukii]|uniref:Uncharacterized protein, isoform A n=8 Tax=melanogaster group TaxID=32346 RepID=A0A1L4AAF3_DROME|nr:uncharacterized protein Dmel_CG46320, isoform A [Drosophila melanogaster]NP_001334710.1 uncharacterized protein Dmel_CG46320, isoform B [Drosophila melanogaster]XP_001972010.1 uncharacterized protein LOC6544673 [Drosophila erecta]XP_002035463.1 uncharacterized protein LOC6610900 [Drosophila sechellia]XP_002093818.1 uncharacterized protein LOC6533086 [Drosophila yakuba]XP_016030550.1 uncharacterized protein LOC6736902 [Drosophila simulans]XP_017043590.2 uncharacterized protein LOC122319712 |eukprot:NP_001334709.1 uncharacterized protein Dmel_CG46320, isoform A [Drosophila melanogaster]